MGSTTGQGAGSGGGRRGAAWPAGHHHLCAAPQRGGGGGAPGPAAQGRALGPDAPLGPGRWGDRCCRSGGHCGSEVTLFLRWGKGKGAGAGDCLGQTK
jgi:hypothetical protein